MGEPGRIVDIFSGCGGLSLGFQLVRGGSDFRTVLAVDVDPDAVHVLNANHRTLHEDAGPVATTQDMSAFKTAHEVRAFYLEHLASLPGYAAKLGADLRGLDLAGLRADVEALDRQYFARVTRLIRSKAFRAAAELVDQQTRSSTLFRAFLDRLDLPALGGGFRTRPVLAWSTVDPRADADFPIPDEERRSGRLPRRTDRYACEVDREWEGAVDHLKELLEDRSPASTRFFETDAFEELGIINRNWRTQRLRRIGEFFDDPLNRRRVDELYARYRVHGLLGAPPCQGFSNAGRSKLNGAVRYSAHTLQDEEFGDRRNGLFRAYLLFLEALGPDFFVFENVPRFESAIQLRGERRLNVEGMLREELDKFKEMSYRAGSCLVHAHRHGLPQRRSRYLLVGFRADRYTPLATDLFVASVKRAERRGRTNSVVAFEGLAGRDGAQVAWSEHGSRNSPICHVIGPDPADHRGAARDFARFIRTMPGRRRKRVVEVPDHWARRPNDQDRPLFARLGQGEHWGRIEGLEAVLREIAPDHHLLKYLPKKSSVHKDWLARMDAAGLSRTICAHLGKDGYAYIHPTEPRSISVREAARLQGFPDWFSFGGVSMSASFRMIGNAFPPFVACQVAEAVLLALDSVQRAERRRKSAHQGRGVRKPEATATAG